MITTNDLHAAEAGQSIERWPCRSYQNSYLSCTTFRENESMRETGHGMDVSYRTEQLTGGPGEVVT